MSVLIIWASPNKDGLTSACVEASKKGVLSSGKTFKEVHLNENKINSCQVCDRGFGLCNTDKHECIQTDDDFAKIKSLMYDVDTVIAITPVYYGEMSEPMKTFFDRLRRCDAKSGRLAGKKCICIAAAGGSGNGAVDCLVQMDKYMKNIIMDVKDRIPVTRFSKEYMLTAIEKSAEKLCE